MCNYIYVRVFFPVFRLQGTESNKICRRSLVANIIIILLSPGVPSILKPQSGVRLLSSGSNIGEFSYMFGLLHFELLLIRGKG